MNFTVKFTKKSKKQLQKMDKHTALLITGWLRKNIENCTDPYKHGKGLTANHRGQWRYRVGNYRIIAEIQDEKVIVLVVSIGHRKDIYKNIQ